jgi:tetratricopeptide (TPR) repeat protein
MLDGGALLVPVADAYGRGMGMADSAGSGDGLRVFISHTSEMRAFPEGMSYVAAVERAVAAAGHVIVDMADFPTADRPPAELCAERVRGCDVYVGVLGTRYGSPVRDRPDVSYTELEFETATEENLDRLVFLLDEGATDVGIPLSALLDREFGSRQDAFRRRIQDSGLVTGSFANPDMLGRLAERSLRELAANRPGSRERMLQVWNIPARNPGFTGRDGLLAAVRERLVAGDTAVVQAFQGMGGVGKTQLAIEYAHRFADGYDLAWWVNAEQGGLIGDQFAALGMALGCVQPGAATEVVRGAVLGELRRRDRWLLVFDNAQDPEDLEAWLPGGTGHVLVTSRAPRWAEVAVPVEVDVLDRSESMALLRDRVPGLPEADADQMAGAVGDLPLALAQAAAYLTETRMPAGQYAGLLGTRAAQLMGEGRPPSYPRPLAAVTVLALDRLRGQDLAAAELAGVCAFLAPEPVPPDWFPAAALSPVLAGSAVDPLAWRQVLASLGRSALARVDATGLVMHRLTQAIIRGSLPPGQAAVSRELAEAILAASSPGDTDTPRTWPAWARLLPHLLALEPGATSHPDLRRLALGAARYLIVRGDASGGHDLASRLYGQWRDSLGPDHPDTLSAGHHLGHALRQMGRYREARQLSEDILARKRRVLGEDHPDTLASANGLAVGMRALGEHQAARELDEDTLARKRRVLGEDHPSALISANNLAEDLSKLGEHQAARELDQDILARKRRVLGEDHPSALISAKNLAEDLRDLGEHQAARELDEDTLVRYRRVLGEDHPDTLTSASNLADDLRALGEVQAARNLDQDTLDRKRRVLGEDHPSTLTSANNLAADLRALGGADNNP